VEAWYLSKPAVSLVLNDRSFAGDFILHMAGLKDLAFRVMVQHHLAVHTLQLRETSHERHPSYFAAIFLQEQPTAV
jgi:hypothetical protein